MENATVYLSASDSVSSKGSLTRVRVASKFTISVNDLRLHVDDAEVLKDLTIFDFDTMVRRCRLNTSG